MMLHETSPPGQRGGLAASLVSSACFLRGLPLFFGATPKTPLRVLCLIAFDTLHVLRTSKPLPRQRVRMLATILDLGACANAALDHKGFCPQEYRAQRQWLKDAGIASSVDEYLRRLRDLERRRPSPGGDRRRFDEVRWYRESVARLSLGVLAAIALGDAGVDDGIQTTHRDHDLATLFRLVMLCQIIDDLLDYAEDKPARLPSFLTASASLSQGLELTAETARSYGACHVSPRSANLFPLRLALWAVFAFAGLVIRIRHWQPADAVAGVSRRFLLWRAAIAKWALCIVV